MRDERADAFLKYLEERFQREVFGEAIFAAMADAEPDPRARNTWRVLEALRRESKEYLARALGDRGHEVKESTEQRAMGEKLGRRLVAVPRAVFMTGLRAEVARFVAEYEQVEGSARADGIENARDVTAHERAILEFLDRELARRAADACAPVLALLLSAPFPPR